MKNPEQTLTSILELMGLEFVKEQLEWGGCEHHHVGGNRMRRIKSSELRLDESWKTELGWWQKVMIGLGTFHLLPL